MARRTPLFERISLGLLIGLVLWAPFPLGSNRGWAWGILEAGLFAAGICWLTGWLRGEFRTPIVLAQAWPLGSTRSSTSREVVCSIRCTVFSTPNHAPTMKMSITIRLTMRTTVLRVA